MMSSPRKLKKLQRLFALWFCATFGNDESIGLIDSLERFLETGAAPEPSQFSDFITAVLAGKVSANVEQYIGKEASVAVVIPDNGATTPYAI